ncbi:D-cysteine desulfhydrase family protein [Eubacteriales bacterium KG127]
MKKINLANLPTPVYRLDRLSNELGKEIFIKRDDYTGVEISGNKIRKLEYLLADALNKGADTIITAGAIQSNHARSTTAAAVRLGLSVQLVLSGEKKEFEQNFFYESFLGAKVNIISEEENVDVKMQELAKSLKGEGKSPYIIPIGGSNALGSMGYEECFKEIVSHEKQLGLEFSSVTCAVGSGGTYAGLFQENLRGRYGKKIIGVSVIRSQNSFREIIGKILDESTDKTFVRYIPEDITINDKFIGEGYAQFTADEIQELREIAELTGIIFDPCYTGKAFRGFLYEISHGILKDNNNHLFIHTGGLFGWTKEAREMFLKVNLD